MPWTKTLEAGEPVVAVGKRVVVAWRTLRLRRYAWSSPDLFDAVSAANQHGCWEHCIGQNDASAKGSY